jgi:hypothetical protein
MNIRWQWSALALAVIISACGSESSGTGDTGSGAHDGSIGAVDVGGARDGSIGAVDVGGARDGSIAASDTGMRPDAAAAGRDAAAPLSCTSDSDCAPTYRFCDLNWNYCEPPLDNGGKCDRVEQCGSGICQATEKVCCDKACDGKCESCLKDNTAHADGTCTFELGDSKGVCSGTPVQTCGSNGAGCTGNSNGCILWDATTVCLAKDCTGNTMTQPSLCDGAGTCVPGTSQVCPGNFLCMGDKLACHTTCVVSAHCVQGFRCFPPNCEAPHDLGGVCAFAADCKSGFCADGVCCDKACTAQCLACTAAKTGGTDGTCAARKSGEDDGECTGTGACQPDGMGCNGNAADPHCNSTGLCACVDQYPQLNCCVATSKYCSFELFTTIYSCEEQCQKHGGECIDVYDNTADHTCTVNPAAPLKCTDKGGASVICKCSSGCGTGPSCVAPWKCVSGHCDK